MGPPILKKRKLNDTRSARSPRKPRKQQHYSSPSSSSASEDREDEFPAVDLADSDGEDIDSDSLEPTISSNPVSGTISKAQNPSTTSPPGSNSDSDSDSDSASDSETSSTHALPSKIKSKRNDPTAFASSISAILGSKLTSSKRSDPVLSRSATAAEANASIANTKLEVKARQKLREDKKEALEKGRVKDVLLGTDRPGAGGAAAGNVEGRSDAASEGGGQSVGEMQEQEKRLRKTAQRGVVKLFNAVRQAQVRAEEARVQDGSRGRKEERVGEMTKLGFLEMVAAGGGTGGKGKATEGAIIEEA